MRNRIVFLTRPYPRYPGDPYGAEVLYLAEAMAHQGEDIVLITTTQSAVKSEHVKVHSFPLPRIKIVSFILSYIWAFCVGLAYAGFGKMRVLNLQWAYPLGPIGGVLKKIFPIELITTARGSDLTLYGHDPHWQKIITWVLKSSEGVITVGSGLREIALELGVQAQRISVIPSVGVDQRKFQEAKPAILPGQGVKILYVGGLVPVKGLDILLQAVALLAKEKQDFHLVLIGKGPEADNLHRMVQTLELGEAVSFLGEIPHPQIPSYFKGADIFVLPSRQEGLGIVLIEALAGGLAVAASRTGGIPDIIRDQENGLLVTPENPEELADALRTLIQDENLRQRLAKNGLKVVEYYTYEQAASDTLEFIKGQKDKA